MNPLLLHDKWVSWEAGTYLLLCALRFPIKPRLQCSLCPLSITSGLLHCLSNLIWKMQLLWPWACWWGASRSSEAALYNEEGILGLRGRRAQKEGVLRPWITYKQQICYWETRLVCMPSGQIRFLFWHFLL